MPAHPGERVARPRVAAAGERDELVRLHVRPERLLRDPRRGVAAHVRLEVAATGAGPLAGEPVRDDDDVPELGPAAVERAVEDDPAPAARPEREHDERLCVAPGPDV